MPNAAHPSWPTESDRRSSERYFCGLDNASRLIATVDSDRYPAIVLNLSAGGIALLISRPVDPGSVMAISLFNTVTGFTYPLLLRVMYTVAQESGAYIVGGAFMAYQLEPDELQSLLA